jgi:tape measure domain-containing protein
MADVKVRIIAVDEASEPLKKAGQEVEKVGKKAKEAGGSFEGLGKTMLSIAGGMGLQVGLSAIVGGLKNAVVGSFELADALEQATVSFTTMLGSGEAAESMLNDLKAFADATPFEFMDLQSAAKRLMAMGTAAEDVIPTLEAVGDAAAGLGGGKATIDSITLALGQMGAKGKISTQELNQLTERGIPAMKLLADAAGVSTGEMAKLVEKGLVPAASGVKVLLEGMKENFGGLMAKQAETAGGKLSTMRDAVAGLGTEIGRTLIPAAKEGAGAITEMAVATTGYLASVRTEKELLAGLDEALRKDLITREQLEAVTVKQTRKGYLTTLEEEFLRIGDLTAAQELLTTATENGEKVFHRVPGYMKANGEQMAASAKEARLFAADLAKTTDAQLAAKAASDAQTASLKLHADIFSTLSSASKEYESDTDKLANKTVEQEKVIKDLITAHGKNQAAILAGTGTIKDNSDAIDKSALKHRDLKQDVQQLNEKQAEGKISGENYTLAMDHLNIKMREQNEEHGKLIATHGTGLTAQQLANTETANYTTKLGEATAALAATKEADLLLQTQTATRIKEGMILDLIKDAADGGLQAEEVKRIQGVQTAIGLQDDATITGMLAVQRGSTLLAEFRDTHAKEFAAGNVATAKSFGAAADYIGTTTDNKIIPTLKGMTESIGKVNTPFFELKAGWDGLNSKDVELRITTIRTELIQSVQAAKFGGAGPAMGAPLAGARAGGGAVMGSAGAYLVGEAGPELFNPAGTGGSITPNGALGRGGLAIGTLNVYGVQSTSELFNQLSKEARARGMQFAVN